MRSRFILKQLDEAQNQPDLYGIWQDSKEDCNKCSGYVKGPKGSVYEGAAFYISVHFPSCYPMGPPKIIFKTNIFHPLVNSKGAVKIDILRDDWSPGLVISKVLLTIVSILDNPELRHFKDAKAQKYYIDDKADFYRKARDWTLNNI